METLQQKSLLLGAGKYEISTIWKELCDRLPPVEDSSPLSDPSESAVTFQPTKPKKEKPTTDICIAYSPANGTNLAK